MNAQQKFIRWTGIGVALLVMSASLTWHLTLGGGRLFLPGKTTAGHHQIEESCVVCHSPFQRVKNQACLKCHDEELKASLDSHAPAKFADPRHAQGLAILDARQCVTCHQEHRPAITRTGDVTQPDDHCFPCHADIATERPSHRDFSNKSCATAGCHNYHDNTALYEDFLVKHLHEPDTLKTAVVSRRDFLSYFKAYEKTPVRPLAARDLDAPPNVKVNPAILSDWESTAHARAGVNCSACHQISDSRTRRPRWVNKPDHHGCIACHPDEVSGFSAGRHGMRLAQRLSPMSPGRARLPMKPEAHQRQLTCVACHSAHQFDTRRAAVDSCLSCHNDFHSLAFKDSPHFRLWQAELAGAGARGSGVSCATCHLPRQPEERKGLQRVLVQHNQNLNLRPNEKMIRSVCLSCHGLEFSMSALADPALLKNNFSGRPSRSVASLKMAERRLVEGVKSTNAAKPSKQ